MTEAAGPTAADVAVWMLGQVEATGALYQDIAASSIAEMFGAPFVYTKESNGNLAISKEVLGAFRRLTGERVVWDRTSLCWRSRNEYDAPGRQQA